MKAQIAQTPLNSIDVRERVLVWATGSHMTLLVGKSAHQILLRFDHRARLG